MAFKHSITLASFRSRESFEETLARLESQGYDAVEITGEPDEIDLKKLRETTRSFKLAVCGVTGMWGKSSKNNSKRRLLSRDHGTQEESQRYVRKCIEMCEYLDGREFNVCLFADDLTLTDPNHGIYPESEKKKVAETIIPELSSLAKFASDHNVNLLIEPLNRFSTPYCTTAKDARHIVEQIDLDKVGILLDTFHMNIEEKSFEDAIKESKDFLMHTHIADNNRLMPGFGHIDFKSVIQALTGIGYCGYLSFEPYLNNVDFKNSTFDGLQFIKGIENNI